MSTNKTLNKAKAVKNDEFYTQLYDINAEINAYLDYNPDVFRGKTILLPCDDPAYGSGSMFTQFFAQNFRIFGLKKLISTSYAQESKKMNMEPDLFEQNSPQYDVTKTKVKGKIFVLEENDISDDGISAKDFNWRYLEGDGDFQSDEITKLRDEADFIITNPPFSLFREFLAWIMEGNKKFIILGNPNAIICKNIFPLLKDNLIWIGATGIKNREFRIPASSDDSEGCAVKTVKTCWYTNVEHGRRHEPLTPMTMADNLKYSKYKEIKSKKYEEYDNYNVIEVPYIKAIPSDYEGVMGVPVTYMGVHCPEQFEIIGMVGDTDTARLRKPDQKRYIRPYLHGKCLYGRIFIRKKATNK